MPTLDFKGKQFVYAHHLTVPFRSLEVDAAKSCVPKGTKPSLDDNLIIHGDNLHALKALLPTHAGKIDCVFIDPPYNTGNEKWCYNDAVNSPLMREWLKQASPVDKEDLERHDKWLCMMWPRLRLLKDLLADHGVIFITIDDNEVHRLRSLLDEVFGEGRFVANFIWKKMDSPSRNEKDRSVSEYHDHVICYSKNGSGAGLSQQVRESIHDAFPITLPDGRLARRRQLRKNGKNARREDRQTLWYPLVAPGGEEVWPVAPEGWEGRWVLKKDEWLKREREGLTEWIQREYGWVPYYIEIGKDVPTAPWATIWDDIQQNRQAKATISAIFGRDLDFQTPKPVTLIQRVLEIVGEDDCVVLDSFAGSGTTAHAVLDLNKRDGGNRRFILVECEDYADKLTAERVRRVAKGYAFEGTKREELFSKLLTWTDLKKAGDLLSTVESFENLEGHRFDKITKQVKDGLLTVTGETKITDKVPGLGGSFTFCELGPEITVEGMLTGDKLPNYESLARYVYYTATGQTLDKVPEVRADWFIGENDVYRLHLVYRPDKEWLRSNDAALNSTLAETIKKGNKGRKKALVFAAVKFMGQKELTKDFNIEFCQLPYALHRVLGD